MLTDPDAGPPAEKSKKKKAKVPLVKERILAKYTFVPKEMSELGVECGRITGDINELKEQAKAAAGDFKSRLESKEAGRNSIATKLTNGYEMRETECIVKFFPATSRKQYISVKSKQVVREEDMSPSDFQLPMFRKDEIAGKKPGKDKKPEVKLTGDPKKDALLESAQLLNKVEFTLSNVGPEYTVPSKLLKAWRKKASGQDWPNKILAPFVKLALTHEQDGIDAVADFLRPFTVEP